MTDNTLNNADSFAESHQTVFDELNACVVFALVAILFVLIGSRHCYQARTQYLAASYPHVMGRMTKWEIDEFGTDGEWQLLVEYNYSVDGRRYFGTRKRFAWRHFDSGSPEAKALARSWRKGNQVKVFHNPDDPSDAALDNLFTPGDRQTLGWAIGAICLGTFLLGVTIYDLLVRFANYRYTQELLEPKPSWVDSRSFDRRAQQPLVDPRNE